MRIHIRILVEFRGTTTWEDWISIKNCNKNCFHMLFSSVTWNNIKTFISGNDVLGFLAGLTRSIGGWGPPFFLIRLYFAAFLQSLAGKIIVPVHLNSLPRCIWTPPLQNPRNQSRNRQKCFLFAAQTSAHTMSAILKKKILSGISFTKINKNCPNYPLKLISLAIRKWKNQSEVVLQSGIPMTYQ